jgi:hypothetical protein
MSIFEYSIYVSEPGLSDVGQLGLLLVVTGIILIGLSVKLKREE